MSFKATRSKSIRWLLIKQVLAFPAYYPWQHLKTGTIKATVNISPTCKCNLRRYLQLPFSSIDVPLDAKRLGESNKISEDDSATLRTSPTADITTPTSITPTKVTNDSSWSSINEQNATKSSIEPLKASVSSNTVPSRRYKSYQMFDLSQIPDSFYFVSCMNAWHQMRTNYKHIYDMYDICQQSLNWKRRTQSFWFYIPVILSLVTWNTLSPKWLITIPNYWTQYIMDKI